MNKPVIIKVRFLKDGKPAGQPYPYYTHDIFMIGDIVKVNDYARGIVVDIDVEESEVEGKNIKFIHGRAEE